MLGYSVATGNIEKYYMRKKTLRTVHHRDFVIVLGSL